MEGLFGADFDINISQTKADVKKLVKKASSTRKEKTEEEKLLASKKLTIEERLSIITEKVIKTLGSQRTNTRVIRNIDDFSAYIDKAIEVGRIDIDTETNNTTDAMSSEMVGLCLYVPGEKQVYIPIKHVNYETGELLPNQLTYEDCRKQLQRLLDYKSALRGGWIPDYEGQSYDEWYKIHVSSHRYPLADFKIIMHNGKFDYEVISHTCNIAIAPDWDTIIAARLIDENLYSDKKTSLKWLYVNLIDPKQAKYDIEGLFENIPYAFVDPEIFALYAATDSMMTDKIYLWEQPFFEGEDNKKLKWLFENIEMPIVEVTAKMEMRGVCVDQAFGERLKQKYNNELDELDKKIQALLDHLKPTIDAWRLTPEANEKSRTYVPKKTKMSQEKIEATYPLEDKNGRRYKETKPKTEQLENPINLGSPVQLAILFYDILYVGEVYGKADERKTGKDDLKGIAEALKPLVTEEQQEALQKAIEANDDEEDFDQKEYDIDAIVALKSLTSEKSAIAANLCSFLLERRGLTKLISTYIDVIPDLAQHWADGRIRFRLNSMGTNTGRYSSGGKWKYLDENNKAVNISGINIQNIPSHNPEIRMLFKANYEENTIEAEEGVKFKFPEYTEIETTQGFKYGRDLFNDLSLKVISDEGEILNLFYFEYDSKTRKYYMITRCNCKIRTRTRYKIIGSDYSAQEPRLTAFVSQDQKMIDAYRNGQDLYAVIAQSAFHNNYEDNLEFYPEGTVIEENGKQVVCGKKTHMNKQGKERRKVGKTLQLAATYGMSGSTAGIRLGYSAKEAKKQGEELLNKFFTGFPGVKNTIDYSKAFLKEHEYVEDWAGRRRHLPEINLKKYEVHLKDNNEQANFNPFLGCANREDDSDPSVQYWKEVVRDRIKASQQYQAKAAAREGREWVENDEMSNKQYEAIAKAALNCEVFKYKDKKDNDVIPVTPPKGKLEPVIISAYTGKIAQAERQCFNARIQGGAASLTKLAMINIDRDPLLNECDAHLIITVHDEVLVECPALYADEVEKRLPQIMIDTAKPYINVPMKCDPYNVSRWYADEAAVALRDEFEKMEKGNPEKDIKPIPAKIALEQLYNIHSELDPIVINRAINDGIDLEF